MANVLVVDDALFVRQTIKRMLEANGHTMIGEADSGRLALKRYEELEPDVVLLDITMPGMSGIEVLKKLKAINMKAKVIICSSIGQQAIIAEAIQCGAADFIVKPFKEEQVIASLEKVLAR